MKDLRFIFNTKLRDNISEELKSFVTEYIKDGVSFTEKFKNETYFPPKDKENEKYFKIKWRNLKEIYVNIVENKCPICNNSINTLNKGSELDHYRPKSKYPSEAYNYKNYIILCTVCNGSSCKHTKFPLWKNSEKSPLLFNPTTDNPLELFEIEFLINKYGQNILKVNENKSKKSEYMSAKAKETLKVYKLNDISRNDLMRTLSNTLIEFATAKYRLNALNKADKTNIKNYNRIQNIYKAKCKKQYIQVKEMGFSNFIENSQFKIQEEKLKYDEYKSTI